MALRRLKIATWIALLGLVLSASAFGISILTYIANSRQYVETNTLAMLDKRLNSEVIAATQSVGECLRAVDGCFPSADAETLQNFYVFFGYLDSVAHCVELGLCSRPIAENLLSPEIEAAMLLKGWIEQTRAEHGDQSYLTVTERVFLTE
ncbi:MAG: hypothetical protein ACFB03_18230 [Paracoccaceae bacterium]